MLEAGIDARVHRKPAFVARTDKIEPFIDYRVWQTGAPIECPNKQPILSGRYPPAGKQSVPHVSAGAPVLIPTRHGPHEALNCRRASTGTRRRCAV